MWVKLRHIYNCCIKNRKMKWKNMHARELWKLLRLWCGVRDESIVELLHCDLWLMIIVHNINTNHESCANITEITETYGSTVFGILLIKKLTNLISSHNLKTKKWQNLILFSIEHCYAIHILVTKQKKNTEMGMIL